MPADQPPEVDLYCERITANLFDEPLGLSTNLAFLVAAWALARDRGANHAPQWMLITWLTLIGLGSGAFHAYATKMTLLLDVIPIQGFILTTIWILYRTHLGLSRLITLALLSVFVVVSALIPTHILWGSVGYIPAWGLLILAALLHAPGPVQRDLGAAAALFGISLIFRSIDGPLCSQWESGTHFLWHLCNALVLYWIVRATQRHRRAERLPVGDAFSDGYTSAQQRITDHETR